MKKTYTKPMLVRQAILSEVTAQSGSPLNAPPSKPAP